VQLALNQMTLTKLLCRPRSRQSQNAIFQRHNPEH